MARSSYLATGGDDKQKWEPKVDKDPFHRTMDIFNGVFKKNIKLSAGKTNCTDLHTIYINFGEFRPSKITQILRQGSDSDHLIFLLECGHEWEGKKLSKDGQDKKIGDWGMCSHCGTDTVYRGFEHEWQHIIFKSDLAARTIFCDQYAEQLLKQLPNGSIDKTEITQFLHLLVNAFDDIRVNSLWEKVYPGSAIAIWERWRYFAARMEDRNTSFLPFIFSVAFNIPTNPQGEFEPMRPVIEWALKRVKYRGFNNMLLDVRVVLDRCMGALLAKLKPNTPNIIQPPPPPSMLMPSGDQDDKNQGDQSPTSQALGSSEEGQRDQETGKAAEDIDEKDIIKDEEQSQNGQPNDSGATNGIEGIPSAKGVPSQDSERLDALAKLMQNSKGLDPKEDHMGPTEDDLDTAKKSQSLRAAINHALHGDISDAGLSGYQESDEPDEEMQAQIDQLQGGVAQKNDSSQLTDGARARVTIIPVTRDGVGNNAIELEPIEKAAIQRLRAAFFRSMGKQKAKRSNTGTSVDVVSLIQYIADGQDPDIFENDDVNQGFAYSVVSDMSGSMMGCFPTVCRAVEILKQSLHFPFVVGNLWGFRGGQPIGNSKKFGDGEVWMYKYSRDVDWYTGTVPFRAFPGPNGIVQVPVECGGITPMNTAINVATSHLWRKMPSGMAKRMFLLTDGSPIQTKVTGRMIPEFILRQFVANEMARARRHGIQVYTIVIGDTISDEKCLQMFGPRKNWIKTGQDRVGSVLVSLVLRNFNGYLRRT